MPGRVAAFCCAGLGNLINFTPVIVYLDTINVPVDLYIVNNQVPDAHTIFSGFKCVKTISHCTAVDVEKLGLEKHDFVVASVFFERGVFEGLRAFCGQLKESQHEVEGNFEALSRAIKEVWGESLVPKQIPDTAVSYRSSTDIVVPETAIGIHAGWGGDRKKWERKGYKHWGEVAKELWSAGYRTVSFGTEPDRQGWENSPSNKDLIGKCQVIELGAVMRQLSAFVSADSGLAHYASALGLRSLVLFGPTLIRKNRPWGNTALVLHAGLSCAPCQLSARWDSCAQYKCMEFDPKDIAERIRGIVKA